MHARRDLGAHVDSRMAERGAKQAGASNAAVTMAIVNARVWTGDRNAPWAEAVAIAGDRIVAVGTDAENRALIPSPFPGFRGARIR